MLCGMLSKRLRDARERAGMTQAELAKAAKVKVTLISDIERGKTSVPAYDKLVRLACALGLRPHELFPIKNCDCGCASQAS
jgi:transcriptional regulator with XRE-family HTH domain